MASDNASAPGPREPWLKEGDLLTVEEAANILRVSQKTIREWMRKDQLASLRVGKQWRILRQDLESFVMASKRTAQREALRPSPEDDQDDRPDDPNTDLPRGRNRSDTTD
jgi:excisionase family DNA binding protein